jgi:hypothetical protein
MVSVMVEVEAWEVLQDLKTRDVVKELCDRARDGDREARQALGSDATAVERAIEHLRAGRAEQALEALTALEERPRNNVSADYNSARQGKHPFLLVRCASQGAPN